jgi:hypothetical protein
MGDPRRVRPDELEILVARELRKAGVELSPPKLLGRHALSKDGSEYSAELRAVVTHGGAARDLLIECRNERGPVTRDTVTALQARLLAGAPSGGQPPLGIIFATSTYERDAVREARVAGITLLTIADGRAAFLRSQWAMGEQPPAWVPEYMAELVDLDPAGSVRHQLVVGGTKLVIPTP